ncbi:MAG: TRAP transporter small permease [Polyangiaceae bacterium]
MAKKKTKRHGADGKGASAERGGAESDVDKDGLPPDEGEREEEAATAADGDAEKAAEEAPKAARAASDGGDKSPPAPSKGGAAGSPNGAAWGAPLARFENAWTRFETRLITGVLVAQLLVMVLWVLLSGLASPVQSGNASGLVMRAVIGMSALGSLGWLGTKTQSLNVRRGATILGILVGALTAGLWRTVGVDYFDNLRSWLQEGSVLTLMGGLRGLATRLTLWLALLGGSLATGAGKHINIDVIFRFVPPRVRLPIAVLNYLAAALMCFAAVWGFFDHIAIESFGAKAEDTASAKIDVSLARMGDHFFLTRKQMGIDLRALPHVISGDRYDQWMSAKAWNEWVKGADFEARYPKEEVETILVPDDAPPHAPLVVSPDGEATRGILVHDLSLVFPFGMLAIALRFVLRALLALSRQIEIDPDAAHKEEVGHAHDAPAEPKKEGV